jgi:hypothetical protein
MDTSRARRRLLALVREVGARKRLAALFIAVVAAVLTYAIATTVFPYHSSNHDEAVYLQQASMLLSGQLELYAGDLAGAFRPWFFVEDGGRLYPKYQPYPAALYAVAIGLLGEPRIALAAVAGANAALVYALWAMAFDRRVGVVASAVFAASPLALVTTSVFLPYAPTTTLNLLFAVLYLRGVRKEHLPSAAGAGLATGLAFFARPYTAVLFAAPFVAHALFDVGRAVRSGESSPFPSALRLNAVTAPAGLAFVCLSLAYNARLTGSAFVFPYGAFAPHDGPGFGSRQILGHAIEYTPELALEANGYVLWYFATRWFTAGALGTACALAGLVIATGQWWRRRASDVEEHPPLDRAAVATLAGLLVSVPLGNVAFWGNFNVLATMSDPTDGLISQFGPLYHFDLLVPMSVFAGVGIVTGWQWLHSRLEERTSTAHTRMGTRHARLLLAVVLVVTLPTVAGANAAVVGQPLDRNAAYTDKYETAYEPFERQALEDALVFVPTPYGDWQNHPFQYLRNDPGFDGPVVYALDRSPAEDFAVLDAYPDRTIYRYTYRGEWTPVELREYDPEHGDGDWTVRGIVGGVEPMEDHRMQDSEVDTDHEG